MIKFLMAFQIIINIQIFLQPEIFKLKIINTLSIKKYQISKFKINLTIMINNIYLQIKLILRNYKLIKIRMNNLQINNK